MALKVSSRMPLSLLGFLAAQRKQPSHQCHQSSTLGHPAAPLCATCRVGTRTAPAQTEMETPGQPPAPSPGRSTDPAAHRSSSGPLSPCRQAQPQGGWLFPGAGGQPSSGGHLEEVGIKGLPARHIHLASGSSSCTNWLHLLPK